MAEFPSLQPTTRIFQPGGFSLSSYRAYTGLDTRVRQSALPTGPSLNLTFDALTAADAALIRSHFETQQGSFLPFDLPAVAWDGFTGYASLIPEGYQWTYASPPRVDDIGRSHQRVSVELQSVYSYTHTVTQEDRCQMVPEEEPVTEIRVEVRQNNGSDYVYQGSLIGSIPEDVGFTDGPYADRAIEFANMYSGLSFDAPEPVAVGAGDFTVEAFYRPQPDASSRSPNYPICAVSLTDGADNSADIGILDGKERNVDAGTFLAYISAYTTEGSFYAEWYVETQARGAWYHVALERKDGQMYAYLNGELMPAGYQDTGTPFGLVADLVSFYVGSGKIGSTTRLPGRISQARFTPGAAIYTSGASFPTGRL